LQDGCCKESLFYLVGNGTDLLQLHCGNDILDSCGQVGLRVRQGIRAAERQSKTGTGIEWIATSEEEMPGTCTWRGLELGKRRFYLIFLFFFFYAITYNIN
jgi:hypothetical protein